MVGLELVKSRETREPYERATRLTEGVVRTARERGVLVYSGTGMANGVDGDTILLGPPFVVTDDELVRIADVITEAIAGAIEEIEAARSPAAAR
jgi:adenosylmethionine-8-amino-7-oxononanoate aminotransferase